MMSGLKIKELEMVKVLEIGLFYFIKNNCVLSLYGLRGHRRYKKYVKKGISKIN